MHTIKYTHLRSLFFVHSIWNERNECLSWDDTVEWAELLGLDVVPLLYRGPFEQNTILSLVRETYEGDEVEGVVVRAARSFSFGGTAFSSASMPGMYSPSGEMNCMGSAEGSSET